MRVVTYGDAMKVIAACAIPIKAKGRFHPKNPCPMNFQRTCRRETQGLRQTANIDQSDIARRQLNYASNEGVFP